MPTECSSEMYDSDFSYDQDNQVKGILMLDFGVVYIDLSTFIF